MAYLNYQGNWRQGTANSQVIKALLPESGLKLREDPGPVSSIHLWRNQQGERAGEGWQGLRALFHV